MPRAIDTRGLRDVMQAAEALMAFDRVKPHPGVQGDLATRLRECIVADLNAAMAATLAEMAAPSGDAPDAAPEVSPAT